MATERKKLEEKQLKTLRAMVALSHNKHCFDCGQRGPTYVNMTIGCYVCTACSGVLRGLNPPHRVKSVSMASFTPDEIQMLTQKGNEYNRHVWLGMHDTKQPPEIDTKDEIKLRDYMSQKYEKKRWYMPPTDLLTEQAKKMNLEPAPAANRGRAGSGFAYRGVGLAQPPRIQVPAVSAAPAPSVSGASFSTQPTAAAQPPATVSTSSGQTATDLLSDVFAASSGTNSATQPSFQPDFAAFNNMPSNNSVYNNSSPLVQPMSTTQGGIGQQTGAPAAGGGNKYAAFADLFSDTSTVTPAAPASQAPSNVEWNAVNWSTSSSPAQSSGWSQSAQPAPVQVAATSHATQWGAQQPPTNVFSTPPAAPPGAQNMPGWNQPSQTATPQTAVNPFLAAGTAQQPQAFNAFGAQQPAPFGQPAKTAQFNDSFQQQQQPQAMFPGSAVPQQQSQQQGSFGSFPASSSNGAFPTAFPPQQPGFGVQASWSGQPNGNHTPSSANPFMTQTHQPAAAAAATNPFL